MLVHRRRRRDERGAAAIEFALLVLPLMLVLGGIVNFGVVFSQKLALDNAVRQAARAAVVDTDATGDEIEQQAADAFNDAAIADEDGTRVPTIVIASTKGTETCVGSDFGDELTVTGTFDGEFLFPWMLPGMPQAIELKSEGKFQCEFA